MVSTVTISGSHNQTVTLQFDSTSNLALASQLAQAITAGVKAGAIITDSNPAGPPPTVPAGATGAYIQATAGFVALPPDYSIDLVTKPGPAVVLGSGAQGQIILSDAATDLTFLASGGSGTVVAGGGNDRIAVAGTGGAPWALYTGSGNDIITVLGDVNATVGAGGGSNAILLGTGNSLVVSAGDDSIQAAGGNVTVDATQAKSDFVQALASHLLFIGGAGGATIIGGTGSDTYFGSAGHTGKQLIEGGSAGNNFLMAGDGAATVIGGGNNDQLYAYGNSAQLLQASSGNETLSAAFSSGKDTLAAGSGNDQLIGGTGADTYVGGSGNATVTAGSGKSLFEFINGHAGGSEVVMDLTGQSAVHISLDGYGPNAIQMALYSQTVTNGSVTISLADGTQVTFDDITRLDRSNFTSH